MTFSVPSEASKNLLVIINDILDLSKIEAGKFSIKKIGFIASKVVDTTLQVLIHKAEEKGIKLIQSFAGKIDTVLIGDPYRLNQILLNLISNSLKFTDKGEIEVRTDFISDLENAQILRFSVKDTGIGMDKEYVDKLFEKFSQESDNTSRISGGTGLGMSICKELVVLMGGTIEVKSEKQKGTEVSFTLEFTKGTEKDLPVYSSRPLNTDFLRDKLILVTDDNEMNRLVATTFLENYHCSILEATNGKEAIKMLEHNPIDLILMDLQMPILNGFEATRIIRENGNTVPIIALTANAIKGENEKCFDAGMNDYISKPFNEDEFLIKIENCLAERKTTIVYEKKELATEQNKLFDLSILENISRGNKEFVNSMIQLFCTQTPLSIVEMNKALEINDLETIGKLAHKIKPSIDNLQINSLKQVIRKIEMAEKEKISLDELHELIELTSTTINLVIEQMNMLS
ncbi:MAG: ATP-binding protein [Saprospiraceae bacterium]